MTSPLSERDWRLRLLALWLFLMLSIIFRDLHQFAAPGLIDMLRSGEVFGQQITDGLMLYGGFVAEVMVMMALLPVIVPILPLRWINGFAAVFTFFHSSFAPILDGDDIFFLVITVTTLAVILHHSIRPLALPSPS